MSEAENVLKNLWQLCDLQDSALEYADIPHATNILPSSFHVGLAAQCSIASAALSAAEIWHRRTGQRQRICVPMHDAELECTGYFTVDGQTPEVWAKISGLYRCGDGYVRIHANFDHHRDGILKILGLPTGTETEKTTVQAELEHWSAKDLEQEAADKGLVVAMLRSFDTWDQHPQAEAVSGLPLFTIEKIAESDPVPLLPLSPAANPLSGIRVLDLTRILAGPVCGRTLAAYGADVMLINSPNLPNIESIVDTSRGKLSAWVDLSTTAGVHQLNDLVRDADIFIQGYRPGGLERFGFGVEELSVTRPGLIYASLSAYGHRGPWSLRRGFDSLVQTATGFNHAEGIAAGKSAPKPMPVQILDYASGFLMAYGVQAALLKREIEGGSWHVQVSLLQTARWLRSLGRKDYADHESTPVLGQALKSYPCGYGSLKSMPHAAGFSATPPKWPRPSVQPGTHPAAWPA